MVSSQGVRQLCPEGVFTSAPAGSDSNRTSAVGGDEFRKFRLGTDAEQAATVNPHAMTAMTRLIITPPLWRLRAAIPRAHAGLHATGPPAESKRKVWPKV